MTGLSSPTRNAWPAPGRPPPTGSRRPSTGSRRWLRDRPCRDQRDPARTAVRVTAEVAVIGGLAMVGVRRLGVAAGDREVEVGPRGALGPVDEGRFQYGAGLGALEGLLVDPGRILVAADLHRSPAHAVGG